MTAPPDGVHDAPLAGLDPEAVLDRDSRVLLDPRFLGALHRDLPAGDLLAAKSALLRMGFLHGMQDAFHALAVRGRRDAWTSPLGIRCRRVPAGAAIEVHGDWPECREAEARLGAGATARAGGCGFSAGYTSGWLSAMFDADLLAVEQECSADGHRSCRFVAREASLWTPEALGGIPPDVIPFEAFRVLVRARAARLSALNPAFAAPEPPGIDRDSACIHIWGPVMVIPFGGAEEGLRALELIGSDPDAAEVSVVVVHLGHALIDEAFGALALEQIVQTAEAWGAETLIAEPSSLCERILAELSHPPLLILKDLEQAVGIAFQIAHAQRRLC